MAVPVESENTRWLPDNLVPISKQLALMLSMVVGVVCRSVSVSVTTAILANTTPVLVTVVPLQLGPEQVSSGQSSEPHGTWVMEHDWDGSKAGMSHAVPHGLHWSVTASSQVSNPMARFCAGVP